MTNDPVTVRREWCHETASTWDDGVVATLDQLSKDGWTVHTILRGDEDENARLFDIFGYRDVA